MNLQYKIILALIAVIIAMGLIMSFKGCSNDKEKLMLRNQIASNSQVIKDKDNSYSRLLQESTSKSDAYNFIKQHDDSLSNVVSKYTILLATKAKVESVYVEKQITLNDNTSNDASIRQDTVFSSDSTKRYKVSFTWKNSIYSIKAYTLTSPPFALVEFQQDPFNIFVVADQDSSNIYRFTLKFTDLNNHSLNWKVSSIEGVVNPKAAEKNSSWAFGVGGLVSADMLSPGILVKAASNNFLLSYRVFQTNVDLNNFKWYNRIVFGYFRNL